jgi:hypothetical protein
MPQSFLDQAIAYSFELLTTVEGEARNLPEPMGTVLIVSTTQGLIDNGGLEYFFESDFPLNPPYSMFVDAFRRIGADSVASCIEVSANMFPFAEPHLHAAQREAWIDAIEHNEKHEFALLSNRACGDETVWQKLAEFVDSNRDSFGARKES